MNNLAIKVENITKIYELYEHPIDRLKESFSLSRRLYHKKFVALNQINFEVDKGQTIGIIGKNGSGKSTLLKIITGVLTPSVGNVQVNGRIASLLELGAGFNPEYTGLENIYFQGTLMGFTRNEMDVKLDNILSFADIGEFIHQPVRVYSSGMFARLAFSVAINVEPEVLIIDEALSVGDFAFQYKCFMKFKELKSRGITILFVTHGMQDVIKYCDRAIYLKQGLIRADSYEVENVVFAYETETRSDNTIEYNLTEKSTKDNLRDEHRFGSQIATIENINILQNENPILISGKKTQIIFDVDSNVELKNAVLGYSLKNSQGVSIWGDATLFMKIENEYLEFKEGTNKVRIQFNGNIVPGEYYFYIGLSQFNNGKKIDIDQRWRVKKIKFHSDRIMAEGYIYSPSSIEIF